MEKYEKMKSTDKAIFILKSIAKHDGKMAGIPSISTSALVNPFCTARRACNNTVCKNCYACKYLKLRKTLREKTERNTDFYTSVVLSDNDIPTINAAVFRFESFGEIYNTVQLQNYFNIAWNNEHCTFSLWTKNHDLVIDYCSKHTRPANLNIIFSSRYTNISDYNYLSEKYGLDFTDNCDAVFTVYDKQFAAENNIPIHCGGNRCIDCMRCYKHLANNNSTIEINELLK